MLKVVIENWEAIATGLVVISEALGFTKAGGIIKTVSMVVSVFRKKK